MEREAIEKDIRDFKEVLEVLRNKKTQEVIFKMPYVRFENKVSRYLAEKNLPTLIEHTAMCNWAMDEYRSLGLPHKPQWYCSLCPLHEEPYVCCEEWDELESLLYRQQNAIDLPQNSLIMGDIIVQLENLIARLEKLLG